MKMEMKKKVLLSCVAACSMVAGVASAISWAPTAVPPDVGYWDDAANWGGTLPAEEEKTQFSATVATECVVRFEQQAGQIVMGDGGDETGLVSMRIVSGGILHGNLAGGAWVGVGYNRAANCVVEAGGLLNAGTRLGVGMVGGGVGLLEVYGDVTLAGNLQVASGGDGTVMLYQGGTISAVAPEFGANALMDIWGDGELTFAGDYTNTVNGFIADGKIIGNRLTNNVTAAIVIDAGVTNTVVGAIPSIPNVEGLTLSGVTNMLASFGYTVGTVSYGFVSGALTDHVIGQNPVAGSAPLSSGASVDVVLQELSIPDLTGLSLAEATITLEEMTLAVGVVTPVYEFDKTPDSVLDQDPAPGGAAASGQAIDLTVMEPRAANADVNSVGSGNWMNPAVWNNAVPVRETQSYKVKGINGSIVTLTNKVAVRTFVGGDGSAFQLDIMDGGHLVSGQFGDWCAVGYSAPMTLNVYAGGVFESRKNMLYGYGGGASSMNIDGGTVSIGDWMSLGKSDESASTETTIKNGGSLMCVRFRDMVDNTNGVITVYDGTFGMFGTGRISALQAGLDAGMIKIAPGYVYTLSNSSGDSLITSFMPGYDSWAGQWGEDIGTETEDADSDGALNLYEYALNGDPTDGLVTGVDPVFVNNGGVFEYIHLSRADDTNLVYTVVTTDDLVNGTWAAAGSPVIGTNITGEDYNVITNEISTGDNKAFVKLEIVNP